LTQAQYAAGDFRQQVLQGSLTATVRVHTHTDNVAGVKLPVFRQYEIQSEVKSKSDRDNLGLAQGGRQIKACKEKFTVFLTNLVRLASLQTSFITLDEALKVRPSEVFERKHHCFILSQSSLVIRPPRHSHSPPPPLSPPLSSQVTNRRVNALENVTIPRIEAILAYINRELDELEREDFTRLKKVQGSKKVAQALAEAEEEAKHKAAAAAAAAGTGPSSASGPRKAGSTKDVTAQYDTAGDSDIVF
jgi:V-type H+-transporting ATPase subunit D